MLGKASTRARSEPIAAARHPAGFRLRAVVLTYFDCGPDPSATKFSATSSTEPCYVMQLDEHTADAA